MNQVIDDPTKLIVRIGELVSQGRQFSAVQDDNGKWLLAYGGPPLGRARDKNEENKK